MDHLAPVLWMILRMIMMAASCPSNRLAAVTIRILFLGMWGVASCILKL